MKPLVLVAAHAGGTASGVLAVGDTRRPRIGRAVLGTLLAAVVYEAFAFGVKEIPALGNHAPWANDPYDVVTSSAIFFVPILAAVCAVRLPLCRRAEPLPWSRAIDLLRGSRAILGVAILSVLADWTSVFAGADRPSWSSVTPALIAWLGLVTVLTVMMSIVALRVGLPGPRGQPQSAASPDALADAIVLGEWASRRLGPFESIAQGLIRAADRLLVTAIRRHPEISAALAAAAFGSAIAASASMEEGLGAIFILFFAISWCSMFAFLIVGGAYLGVVRRSRRLTGLNRRLLDALVVGSASVLIAVAFRDSLWLVFGATAKQTGLPRIGLVLFIAAASTFAVTFIVETLVRAHERDVVRSTRG